MKPANIIIAAATLILLSGLLSGCGEASQTQGDVAKEAVSLKTIEDGRKVMKDVSMKLTSDKQDKTVTVNVVLDNQNQKPITSVESWLSYDPKTLKGIKIDTSGSLFALTAPYSNTFDAVNGLVMIGRSNNTPVSDQTINVVKVVFELIGDNTTMVDIYDYQNDLTGHASANMMLEDTPYNVLIKPESPALIIQK
jgi:hypothetical protein